MQYDLSRFIEAQESEYWGYSIALLEHSGEDIVDILGELDAKKTRSCMTLFDYLSPDDVFGKVLDTFYKGQRGGRTLRTIKRFQEESCQ